MYRQGIFYMSLCLWKQAKIILGGKPLFRASILEQCRPTCRYSLLHKKVPVCYIGKYHMMTYLYFTGLSSVQKVRAHKINEISFFTCCSSWLAADFKAAAIDYIYIYIYIYIVPIFFFFLTQETFLVVSSWPHKRDVFSNQELLTV